MDISFLTILIALPLVGAVVVASFSGLKPRAIRFVSLGFTLLAFLLSLYLFVAFDRSSTAMQFVEKREWMPSIGIFYHLGIDGISLPMVVLTAFLGVLVVLVSWRVELRVREYFAWLLVLEAGVLGVFTSLDLILFFLFWEVELIPMYMLISIWGSGRKEYSATKFVIFTLVGSALMLAGFLLLYFLAQPYLPAGQSAFDITALSQSGLSRAVVPLLPLSFWLIFLGFAVKLPMFPLHTWLPDAHTDAPTAVSVILAGILLKMGGYGMIRMNVGIFPGVAQDFALLIGALAVVSVLYGAAITLRQKDLKRLVAFSSVSHMGYVLLGIFALTQVSLTGAVLQMVSHGIVTGLLFALVGLVYEKSHVRDIDRLGGLARQMPVIAVIFTIGGLAALGLPGTSGFAAEFLVFLGSFKSSPNFQLLTILAAAGIVIAAGYILWLVQRTFHGPPREKYEGLPDASRLEMVPIFAFTAAILVVGIFPFILTDVIKLTGLWQALGI